jgi:hypothetical protein
MKPNCNDYRYLLLDTTDERNGLIERVYPRLREYCLTKYNIQFQVISWKTLKLY